MTISLVAKEDKHINDVFVQKDVQYRAVILDMWKMENRDDDIIGMEITGGIIRHEVIVMTRKEMNNVFWQVV